jgi:uncharacterized protein
MEYREIGTTGLKASRVGVGGFAFAITRQRDVERSIHRALDRGINYFDSARLYGTEGKIGKALKGKRNEIILSGKCQFRGRKEAEESLHKSLSEIGTDHFDIFHIHGVENEAEWEEIAKPGGLLDLWEEFQKQGKIRFIGTSSHDSQVLVRALKTGRIDLVYGRYNPTTRQNEDSAIPLSTRLNKGFITISALAWGIYSVPAEHHSFLVKGKDMPPAAAAFRYVLSNPDVDVVLAGVRNPEELDELIDTESLPPPDEEEKAQIIYQSERLGRGAECTQCGVCLPCPEGINIPVYFQYKTYLEEYHTNEYPALTWQAFVKPFSEGCTECGICEERCPFDLPIITTMKEIDEKAKTIRHPTYQDEYD